jgi:thiol-disulfide isomerase/thioredoxin
MFTHKFFIKVSLLAMATASLAVVHNVDNLSSLITTKKVVVVKVYAPFYCDPCNKLAPKFQELSNNYAQNNDVAFVQIRGDKPAAKSLGLRSYPTVIVYKDGKEFARLSNIAWTSAALNRVVTSALQ